MDTPLLANLVAYSAQVMVVVAVGAALAALVRVDAPGVRYVYWRALLVLCLVLPWLQVRRQAMVPAADPVSFDAAASSTLSTVTQGAIAPAGAIEWGAFIGWLLLAGLVVRTCRVGVGLWRLRRLRRAGTLAPPCAIHDEAQELVRARLVGVWAPYASAET